MLAVQVTGASTINANFALAAKAIENNLVAGMIKSGIFLRNDMRTGVLPITPEKYRNLVASYFITTIKGSKRVGKFSGKKGAEVAASTATAIATAQMDVNSSKNLTMIIGYGANYAIWVHEMPEHFNWTKPGSGPKWFEKALKRNKATISKMIGKEAYIITKKHYTATKMFNESRTELEIL